MFFFALAVFLVSGWFLPWWALAAAALFLGLGFPRHSVWSCTAGGAVAWAVLAVIKDGHSHGLISQRMSGLFGFPSDAWIFVLVAALAGVTALLFFGTGRALRRRLS